MYPRSIEVDRAVGRMSIVWEDGHQSVYSVTDLRWACPCATCQGEWGRPGILSGIQTLPSDELQLVDVQPVGAYAVMPIWSSGHRSGIYSFEYLRSICPCGRHPA